MPFKYALLPPWHNGVVKHSNATLNDTRLKRNKNSGPNREKWPHTRLHAPVLRASDKGNAHVVASGTEQEEEGPRESLSEASGVLRFSH